MHSFRYRGLVEGFYGTPWSHVDRLWMLERIGEWGMNRYVYAPKEDPLHREQWRALYPAAMQRQFRELIAHGARYGIDVGFALSPGLSIAYSSPSDRAGLLDKLRGFTQLGASLVVLAVDDVPARLTHAADREAFRSLAHAHVDLIGCIRDALGPAVAVWLVPTEYLGVASSGYLEELGRELPEDVEIAWTGRTVLSPTIELEQARARATSLKRAPWLWDNLPVADGPMRHMLHMAPYLGRDARLCESLSGVLLNPMQHARASAVTIHTACAYLNDPQGYDPETAWDAATMALGGAGDQALRVFARAHRFTPQSPDDRDCELEAGFDRLRADLERGADLSPAIEALRACVELRAPVAEQLRATAEDRRFVQELEPWLESHQTETLRMRIALTALAAFFVDGATVGDKMLAYIRMEARLTRLPAVRAVSYGPRRVLYPQLRSMQDDAMLFTAEDPQLLRDRCLADEIVDFVADLAVWMLTSSD